MGPPTCECFVSSTDVQEGAGPSDAGGQSTPSPEHHSEPDPLGNHESSVEGSGHTAPQEVVEEETVNSDNDVCLYLKETPLRVLHQQVYPLKGLPL